MSTLFYKSTQNCDSSRVALSKKSEQSPPFKTLQKTLTTCLKCKIKFIVDCNKASENSLVFIRCPKCRTLTKLTKLIGNSKKSCNVQLSSGLTTTLKIRNPKSYDIKTNGAIEPKRSLKVPPLQPNIPSNNSTNYLNNLNFDPTVCYDVGLVRIFCQKCKKLINCNEFHDHESSCSKIFKTRSNKLNVVL